MCDPVSLTIAAVTLTAAAGSASAYGQYKQGSSTKKYYDKLADQSRMEGDLALKLGDKQSELVQDAAKQEGKVQKLQSADLESAQRAALVSNGIDLSSVTAEDIASDSMGKAKLDELMIRFNADSKSWSIKQDAKYKKWTAYQNADNLNYQGKAAKQQGKMGAATTLLSTAASMAMIGAGGLGSSGTAAKAGQGGYGAGTPSGARNMGSWTKLP